MTSNSKSATMTRTGSSGGAAGGSGVGVTGWLLPQPMVGLGVVLRHVGVSGPHLKKTDEMINTLGLVAISRTMFSNQFA